MPAKRISAKPTRKRKTTRTTKAARVAPVRKANKRQTRKAPARAKKKPAVRAKKATETRRKAPHAKSKSQGKAVSPDAARIKSVLDELSTAQAELTARSVDLLRVADELGRNAVETHKQAQFESLVEDQLLPELQRLREHLASVSTTPDDLRLVAETALNWLARALDLSEHLETGQSFEIPRSQMDQFDFDGAQPDSGEELVRVVVLAPGWKRRGRIVIPPQVRLVGANSPEASERNTETPAHQ